MTVVLISWIYIAAVCMIVGAGFNLFWEKVTGYAFRSAEMYFLSGIAAIGVYAQCFSLLSGLGATANALLVAVCLILCIAMRGRIAAWLGRAWENLRGIVTDRGLEKAGGSVDRVEQGRADDSVDRVGTEACAGDSLGMSAHLWHVFTSKAHRRGGLAVRILAALAIVALCAVLTAQTPTFYDSYLYHAQAIRWIEEYGCVPGLGNLHNRFAYNSSFLVLQALFSFRWLTGSSLHTLNGLVAAVFTLYSTFSLKIWKRHRLYVSDALRFVMIWYVLYYAQNLSSPNTDTFALTLVLYIFIKWFDNLEEGETRPEPYAWACLMVVFACTLKLSSAFALILLVKPIVVLLRDHRWGEFLRYVVCALLIALPFLVRNVVISGYILYPYSSIDIFPFLDWKMDAASAEIDRKEICVWGRGIQDAGETYDVEALYSWPISQWLPVWFGNLPMVFRVMFAAALLCSVGIVLQNAAILAGTASRVMQRKARKTCQRDSQPQYMANPQQCGEIYRSNQTTEANFRAVCQREKHREQASGACSTAPSTQHTATISVDVDDEIAQQDIRRKSCHDGPAGSDAGTGEWSAAGGDYLLVSLTAVACLYGWLLSAPLIRYGGIYMMVVIMVFGCSLLQRIGGRCKVARDSAAESAARRPAGGALREAGAASVRGQGGAERESVVGDLPGLKARRHRRRFPSSSADAAVTVLIGAALLFHGGKVMLNYYTSYGVSFTYQDYQQIDCVENEWEGYVIYTPVSGDQTDSSLFPAIPYESVLSVIELRGETFADGFRRVTSPTE